MDNDLIMNKINNSIREVFKSYKGLYLYGSRAKHTEQPDSDYDIVFLKNRKLTREEESAIYGVISDLEAELDIFMDTRFLTEEELERDPFFYREVVNYGKFYAV